MQNFSHPNLVALEDAWGDATTGGIYIATKSAGGV
jgi:hypothetical protein